MNIPRPEIEQRLAALSKEISSITSTQDKTSGRSSGFTQMIGWLFGGAGMLIGIIGVILAATRHQSNIYFEGVSCF